MVLLRGGGRQDFPQFHGYGAVRHSPPSNVSCRTALRQSRRASRQGEHARTGGYRASATVRKQNGNRDPHELRIEPVVAMGDTAPSFRIEKELVGPSRRF